ncbi:hypothetical protein ACTXT7_008097 [Hymenolepis weldensis]
MRVCHDKDQQFETPAALFSTASVWISIFILIFCCIILICCCIRVYIIQKLGCRLEQRYNLELAETKNEMNNTKDFGESIHNPSGVTMIIWRRRGLSILETEKSSDSDLFDGYEIVDGDEQAPCPSTELESGVSENADGNKLHTRIFGISSSECASVNTSDSSSIGIRNRPLPSTPKEDEDN